jgi:RNA polymerase sigma-70 factor, ECF subfamily
MAGPLPRLTIVDDEPTRAGELLTRAVAGDLRAEELALLGDDDAALLAGSVRGDAEAFDRLVERHYQRVYRLACHRLRDPWAAGDVTQETFCRALRALRRRPPVFPEGCPSVAAWLGRICCNLCTDDQRRQERSGRIVPLDGLLQLAGGEESVELRVERRHAMRALTTALHALPRDDCEAFCLVYVVGYSRQDVAELLGQRASTIRTRVQRARGRLASAMREHGHATEHDGGSRHHDENV